MKKLLSAVLLISFSLNSKIVIEPPYKMNHRVISKLDGIRYAMDTLAVTNIWEVLVKVRDIMNRKYTANGITGNISELCKLEELNDASINQELLEINKNLKKEFVKATFKFIGDIQASKHLIFELMKASCDHKGITNHTLLMKWAQIDHDEERMFDITVATLGQMEQFLTDLHGFLFDLLSSCPKACKMFKKEKSQIYAKLQKFMPNEMNIFETYCLPK